jgi:uncharacterized protein YndB with AHSA1/START domain
MTDESAGGGGRRTPYLVAGTVLGVLALSFATLLVVGFLLPSGWEAERAVRLGVPAEMVFPYLSAADRWGAWTPSPETGVELFGPPEGPGSGRRWDDPMYGQGEFVVRAAASPNEVSYEVLVEDGAIRIRGRIQLERDGGGTLLRWREEGDFGWNPLLGYLADRMNELQGTQMEASLASLKALLEEPGVTSERD